MAKKKFLHRQQGIQETNSTTVVYLKGFVKMVVEEWKLMSPKKNINFDETDEKIPESSWKRNCEDGAFMMGLVPLSEEDKRPELSFPLPEHKKREYEFIARCWFSSSQEEGHHQTTNLLASWSLS